jgi:hypothetical protein
MNDNITNEYKMKVIGELYVSVRALQDQVQILEKALANKINKDAKDKIEGSES